MAAPTSFIDLLRLIRNGDLVDEATINKVLRDLDSNDRYLKGLIDQITSGAAIFRRDATIDPAVLRGQPVFFNTETQQYEQGLAQALVVDGVLQTSMTAQLWGLCYYKHNSTKADIVLQGFVEMDMLDIANATGSNPSNAGLYYLSGTTAGRVTVQEPPVSIPVFQHDGNGGVYVRPAFADIAAAHHHYRYDLSWIPAGTLSTGSGRFTIGSPDVDIEGWLPADHASFGGHAPTNAKFGYNLAASSFASSWPPMPLAGATMEFVTESGLVQLPVLDGTVVIDRYGIWWMTNCVGYAPWPDDYNAATTSTTAPPTTCPPSTDRSLVLWYTRSKFQTTRSVVTSLRPKENSVITIRCLSDNDVDQATGDLEIDADLELLLAEDDDTDGYIALKGLNDDGEFTRGPVVSKIRSGSSNVIVSGDAELEDDYVVGGITITVLENVLGAELDISNIKLYGAEEEDYKNVLALGFPLSKRSSYRGDLYIPYDIGVDTVDVALRFWLLARAAGALPDLTLTARVIPRPTSPTALPVADSAVTLTIPDTVLTEDQYIEVTSADIEAEPGSAIQFTLTRDDSGGGDGFNGEVHVIRQRGVITGAT